MNTILKTAIASALLCGVAFASEAEQRTLMSYNVKNGVGLDDVSDCARIAEVIKKAGPEVVAIQEVDSMTRRSNHRFVLGEIASAAGMKAFFAPAIDYDGGKYGIGLLCSEIPLCISRYAMPGREEARAMIVAEFKDYIFACTHLSLTDEDRAASVNIIKNVARKADKPFFIAGDFNAHPDSDVMKALEEEFTVVTDKSALTFPADKPVETLDYIMVYKGKPAAVKAVSSTVPDEPVASDHRPVTAVVEM